MFSCLKSVKPPTPTLSLGAGPGGGEKPHRNFTEVDMRPQPGNTSRVRAWLCPPSQGMEVCKREECSCRRPCLSSLDHIAVHLPPPKRAPPSSLRVPPSLELQVSRRILFPPQLLRGYRETGNTFRISFSRKRAQTSRIREMEWRIKAMRTTYWGQHSLWGPPKSSPLPH